MHRHRSAAERQDPLIVQYKKDPDSALIIDRASTSFDADKDPFHGTVVLGQPEVSKSLAYGIHQAVGGDSDAPNPGDLLCGAVAACLDSTIRIIADRLAIEIVRLEVEVEGTVDVRGALRIDPEIPVGFEQMQTRVQIRLGEGTTRENSKKLFTAAEQSCVNLQTLLGGGSVDLEVER